jgi:hypothetical protein
MVRTHLRRSFVSTLMAFVQLCACVVVSHDLLRTTGTSTFGKNIRVQTPLLFVLVGFVLLTIEVR